MTKGIIDQIDDSLAQEVAVGCDGNVKLNFSVKSHISLFGDGFIEIRQNAKR